MNFIHTIGAFFVFAPFFAFILLVISSRKKLKKRSIGFSADITTFILFISVPVSINALWGINLFYLLSLSAISIAIILLVIEWKKSKEIEVLKYMRKTWRLYFLVLSVAYLLIWMTGLTMTVVSFN